MTVFSRKPLTKEDIAEGLANLPGWEFNSNAISKLYKFGSFREAVSFIVRVGFEAESMDHHPEINNVYSRVNITLNTHDAGNQVTELDLELARRINQLSWI
ncbi:MAG: 4a-hydroxytetrahydrobiopterin dehydratase [Bacteroidetes bacterium]|nr:4a-hydroxytetrahydrobiopterin dehydratase [Bacteroidota bacterium]